MLFKKVMPLLIVYKSIIFHTRCDLALIILLNLWHSDKWKMLSCHFNLLVLIICEVNYVFVGLFFFLWVYSDHLATILWTIHLFQFVKSHYTWKSFGLYLLNILQIFPRIILFICDIVYCIFVMWSAYLKMKKYWTSIGFPILASNFLYSFTL